MPFNSAHFTIRPLNASECGGVYYGPSGVLKSPGFPRPYPNNLRCNYTLQMDPEHYTVLYFTHGNFDIEGKKILLLFSLCELFNSVLLFGIMQLNFMWKINSALSWKWILVMNRGGEISKLYTCPRTTGCK